LPVTTRPHQFPSLQQLPKSGVIEPHYLDLRALSIYTSLSVRTLRRILQTPGGPEYIHLRGKILVKKETWDCWLESHRTQAPDLDAIVNEALASLK